MKAPPRALRSKRKLSPVVEIEVPKEDALPVSGAGESSRKRGGRRNNATDARVERQVLPPPKSRGKRRLPPAAEASPSKSRKLDVDQDLVVSVHTDSSPLISSNPQIHPSSENEKPRSGRMRRRNVVPSGDAVSSIPAPVEEASTGRRTRRIPAAKDPPENIKTIIEIDVKDDDHPVKTRRRAKAAAPKRITTRGAASKAPAAEEKDSLPASSVKDAARTSKSKKVQTDVRTPKTRPTRKARSKK